MVNPPTPDVRTCDYWSNRDMTHWSTFDALRHQRYHEYYGTPCPDDLPLPDEAPVVNPSTLDAPTPPDRAALTNSDHYAIVSCLLSRLDDLREHCCDLPQQLHLVDLVTRLGIPPRLAEWLESCGRPADLGPCEGRQHVPMPAEPGDVPWCRRCCGDLL